MNGVNQHIQIFVDDSKQLGLNYIVLITMIYITKWSSIIN
jgi:hypothetical protein